MIGKPGKCLVGMISGLAVGVFFLWGRPLQAGDLADVTAASDSLQIVIQQALVDEDAGQLASVFTEDGAVISPNGRVLRGRLTIKTSATLLFLTLGGGDGEITRQGINIIDSTAYETGSYVFRRSGDEDGQAWSGRYTAVWRKEAGQWKVARALGLR